MLTRRTILTGLLAAPIIVRAGLVMPIRPLIAKPDYTPGFVGPGDELAFGIQQSGNGVRVFAVVNGIERPDLKAEIHHSLGILTFRVDEPS